MGQWIDFDITELVQQGYNSFILYASYAGVNKNVKIPSNDYWSASKHPRLIIRFTQ